MICSILVLSTAHLPESLAQALNAHGGTASYTYVNGDPDHQIVILIMPVDGGWIMTWNGSPRGFVTGRGSAPPALLDVMIRADNLDCEYVHFDHDADIDPELPTWDW